MRSDVIVRHRHPVHTAAVIGALFFLSLAIVGPWLAPHDPVVPNPSLRLAPPSLTHPMGTDHLGRDLLSRILAAARVSVGIAILVVIVAAVVGTLVGLLAGAGGRVMDGVLMRVTDTFFAFPEMIAALAVAGILGGGGPEIVFALAVVSWMRYARLVRGLTLATAAGEPVALAKLSGVGPAAIARHHLLPPLLPALVVLMTAHVARAILAISGLGFLGFGIPPPTPEWGTMLNEARAYILSMPSYAVLPGMPVVLAALSFNLAGDALRDRVAAAGDAGR
ncbi:MAG: ABC transporter permease subunit [Pseudomonadota bacterium]